MWRLILTLLVLVVACSPTQAQQPTSPLAAVATPSATATAASNPSPSASPNSSPRPQPATPGPLLFAVLEAKIPGGSYLTNTVTIAGLDGNVRATTTYMPMPVPAVECAGAVLPPSAHVAGDKVYFADGAGVVRSLSANGQIARVATFPFSGHQQMLSFAVSPDGSQLLGAVFTMPAKPASFCGTPEPAGYSLDVYSANSGGPSTLLYHEKENLSNGVMALTGWDAVGPFGTDPTVWASQGGGPGSGLGVAVRIDAFTGRVLGQLGDPNLCIVWDVGASGDFVCMENGAADGSAIVSVRRSDGTEIWHSRVTTPGPEPDGNIFNPFLAPDEQHVVLGADYVTEVVGRDGSLVKLGSQVVGLPDIYNFSAFGWLDSTTVIGSATTDIITGAAFNAYVRLSAPGAAVSLGGLNYNVFLGTVHT